MHVDDKLFYVGQKAFIRNNKGEVLVLYDPNLGVDFPGGKVRKGEEIIDALKREVQEETNLEIEVGDVFITWIHDFPSDKKTQNHTVYLAGFYCTYISGTIQLSEEHTDFEWVTKETYKKLKGNDYFAVLDSYFTKFH